MEKSHWAFWPAPRMAQNRAFLGVRRPLAPRSFDGQNVLVCPDPGPGDGSAARDQALTYGVTSVTETLKVLRAFLSVQLVVQAFLTPKKYLPVLPAVNS